MTYINIKNGTETKQYTLTESYAKPYIVVDTSQVLPLTTNTTNGQRLNVRISDTTYRPLEYGSESASATYYTTAINSEGLSETTALTCESTSGTAFEYVTIPNWYVSSSFTFGANNTHYEVTYFGQDLVNNQPFPIISTSAADYGLGYGKLSVTMSSTTRGASFRISRYWSTKSSNGQWITSSSTYNRNSSSTILLQYITSANIPDMQQPWPQPYTGSASDGSRKYYGTFSSVKTTQTSTFKNDTVSASASVVSSSQSNYSERIFLYTGFSSTYATNTVNYYTTYTAQWGNTKVTYIQVGLNKTSSTYSYTVITSDTVAKSIVSSRTTSQSATYSGSSTGFGVYIFTGTNSITSTYGATTGITYLSSGDGPRYTFTESTTISNSISAKTSVVVRTMSTTTSSSCGSTKNLTRSSTSAYSGISSSSSESSGWR